MIHELFRRKSDDLAPIGKYAEFEWVRRVINSCVTTKQLFNSRRLVFLFYEKHNDIELYKRLDKETDYRLDKIIKLLKTQ